jgi:hypothetical protein
MDEVDAASEVERGDEPTALTPLAGPYGTSSLREVRRTTGLRRPASGRSMVHRLRWVSSVAVAAVSFVTSFLAVWVASWIAHAPVAGTAVRWDGFWYYRISQLGYVSALPKGPTQHAALRPAFFPGLPLLERVVHSVVGGAPAATTLAIGAAGLAVSCALLRALVERDFGEEVAWRAMVVFAFFPGAYVFVMGYSEALEIPLALLVLYTLRRRWYLVAAVATAAATGTRFLGVALVASCAVAAARELFAVFRGPGPTEEVFGRQGAPSGRGRWFRLVSALASPIIGMGGLVGFMVFLHQKTGSFLAFQTAERIGWHNSVDLLEPYRIVQHFARHPFVVPSLTVNVVGIVVVAACLVLLGVDGLVRLPLEQSVYAAVLLLAWMFTSNTGAWFRFVESAFPVLALVSVRLGQRWYPTFASAGAFLLGILIVLFDTAIAFSP